MNFFAVSCIAPIVYNGTEYLVTIWYRAEGDSAVGAIPLVTGSSINQLSLSGAAGSDGVYSVVVGGSSAANGIDDSFSGGVFKAPVQVGITDVEPSALIQNNYPSAYNTSVYGHAHSADLAALSATPIFDQVFGIFVNTNSSAFSTAEKAGQGTATASLSLPLETITNALQGGSSNWNDVPDVNGNAVASASLPITIINAEQGSGSRAATDIFFTGDSCSNGQSPILESTGGTADYFSTANVLAAANTVPGAITYASIDNAGSYANLTLVAINGVQPSNLAAAAGEYGDWFEATLNVNPSSVPGSNTLAGTLITFIIDGMQSVCLERAEPGGECVYPSVPPSGADILLNPNCNSPALPVSSTSTVSGGKTIYVNPFSRGGISCNEPASYL